jgi:hypothetical protein
VHYTFLAAKETLRKQMEIFTPMNLGMLPCKVIPDSYKFKPQKFIFQVESLQVVAWGLCFIYPYSVVKTSGAATVSQKERSMETTKGLRLVIKYSRTENHTFLLLSFTPHMTGHEHKMAKKV